MQVPAATTIISTIPLSRAATTGEEDPEPQIAAAMSQHAELQRENSLASHQGETGGMASYSSGTNSWPTFQIPKGLAESQSGEIVYDSPLTNKTENIEVIRRKDDVHLGKLPGADAASGESILAGASFTYPAFTCGVLRVAPGAVKEAEYTNTSSQLFFVTSCQPKSLEVDVATSRFFVSAGDHFFVPLSLPFRLQNHSSIAPSEMTFCVINEQSLAKRLMDPTATTQSHAVTSSSNSGNNINTTLQPVTVSQDSGAVAPVIGKNQTMDMAPPVPMPMP